MASNVIEVTVNWESVKDAMRHALVTGGFGQMWEAYCWENNVPPDIKLGFLDYLANAPDKIFEDDDD
jgi:hypothetical protein